MPAPARLLHGAAGQEDVRRGGGAVRPAVLALPAAVRRPHRAHRGHAASGRHVLGVG